MNEASLLNQRLYGAPGADGSFQPHLDWYGDFLSTFDQYGPFLPNVRDTLIMSSYVDENRSKGLKGLSLDILKHTQVSYEQVTTREMDRRQWDGLGRVVMMYEEEITTGSVEDGDFEVVGERPMVKVQRKMNQLSASEVFDYGCDDTICTVSLANHFQIMLEIEDTVDTWDEVETFPVYLAAQAFVDGVDFSHESMRKQEKEDDDAYDRSWPIVRDYLIKVGFDGTVTPKMIPVDQFDAILKERDCNEDKVLDFIPYKLSGIRLAFEIITGEEFLYEGQAVKVRTPSKWAKIIEPHHALLAVAVGKGDLATINDLISRHFDGEPKLDIGSSQQTAKLMYDYMKLQVICVNDPTDHQRMYDKPLVNALYAHRNFLAGKGPALGDIAKSMIRAKAKGDEDAIDYAIAFDETATDEIKRVLKAFVTMKKVFTRRSLFYKNYWAIKHWKTGKIHSSLNPCGAVTRRYSMARPNLQQLPKKGEAVKFRSHFIPHKRNAVICSIDFSGQELRLAADISGDVNMLACYVGRVLKDIHSITASTAMRMKWGDAVVDMYERDYGEEFQVIDDDAEREYALFMKLYKGKMTPASIRKQADDLRKDSKNVNFAAQFGGQALKLAMTLIMRVADAQLFLDARSLMFPGVDRMAGIKQRECMETGYAMTLGGARRHLAKFITSPNRQEASRAARQAWNFWVQGSAGEMTKLGMTRFWLSGAIYKYDAKFIAPIHDELVTSVVSEHAVDFLRIKHWCMTQPYATMTVPILGSISLGPNFAKQLETGDYYDANAINDAVYAVATAKELELDYQDTYSIVREGRELDWNRSDAIEFFISESAIGKSTQEVMKSMKEMAA